MKIWGKQPILMSFGVVLGGVLALDQITKYLITKHLFMNQSIPIGRGWINLVYIHNSGVAFGFFNGPKNLSKTLLLSGITLVAVGVVFYFLWRATRERNIKQGIFLGMICGGALGNLIDRVRFGSVTDFIDIYYKNIHWPAFNVADASISVGIILLVLQLMLGKSEKT